ncbi:MAG: hypothetical protein ACTS9Y_01115 [Methylophilus sp.]|uniref:hypothetical protein n=1 Tax=Methylophilus sp. TaxID=29541 RepID=UPI003FA0E52B
MTSENNTAAETVSWDMVDGATGYQITFGVTQIEDPLKQLQEISKYPTRQDNTRPYYRLFSKSKY